MRIDLHVHLAGTGQGGTGCRVSRKMARSAQYLGLKFLLGLGRGAGDRVYADRLIALAESSLELDYMGVFAMDGVYDAQGDFQPEFSHLYVPNDYVLDVCKRSPKLLPVISINPQRKDALAELDRLGPQAVALKWLPPMQRFNPSSSAYGDFLLRLRSLGLPVICHSGTEHTFPSVIQQLGDPSLCEPLLKLGIPVIFAHCGTCSFVTPGLDFEPRFGRMLERYDCAFGDMSGFVSLFRSRKIARYSTQQYEGRVFQGSDFPVPVSALYFLRDLGVSRVRELERTTHPLDKDVAIKRALGVPERVFTGAYELLESRIRTIKGEKP